MKKISKNYNYTVPKKLSNTWNSETAFMKVLKIHVYFCYYALDLNDNLFKTILCNTCK